MSFYVLPLSQVFTQCVWALATLAPGRYGPLFESLARSYAAKVRHQVAPAGFLGTTVPADVRCGCPFL